MKRPGKNPTECEVAVMRATRMGGWTTRAELAVACDAWAPRTVRHTVTIMVADGLLEEVAAFPTNRVRWRPSPTAGDRARSLQGLDKILASTYVHDEPEVIQ